MTQENKSEVIETSPETVQSDSAKVKQPKNHVVQNDIMRYKKNKLGSSLALLGIAFGCFYFLILYAQVKNNNFYYTWEIAFDVIYNLFFLLFVFLFSEQVKNYNKKMFPLQLLVGLLQIARIFWLPLKGITNYNGDVTVVTPVTFALLTAFLAASGACVIASAIIGFIRARSVEDFTKKVQAGEIDLDDELKDKETQGVK